MLFAKRRHRIETKVHVFLFTGNYFYILVTIFLEKNCGKSVEDYPGSYCQHSHCTKFIVI